MKTIGSMRALDEQRGAVRVEDVYDTDIDDLWDACTEPERLARWIAEVDGDLRVGGTIQATFTSTWAGPGRIEVCERRTICCSPWSPDTEDEAQIEAWLTRGGRPDPAGGRGARPAARQLHFYGAGWQAHLEDLGRALAGEQSMWKARWESSARVQDNGDQLSRMPTASHSSCRNDGAQ